nr:hypothetical protein [Tanacetum cinerariifolium]
MDQNTDSSGFDHFQPPQYPNHPTFYNVDEEHSVQYKEYLENSSNAIAATYFNQEKEEPPQNSNIRQLIREECGIKVCEEQKQNMEDMMLELLEVCRQKEFYCMHNDVDDLIESALNSIFLLINLRSQRLDKKKQEIKNIVEHPTKRGTQPEYSLSMRYDHLSTIPETESDEVINSSVKNHVQSPREYEVTSDNESECDVDDDALEDIEYVEASLLDSELERLTSVVKKDISDNSTNDPFLEMVDLFLASNNSIPSGIENFDYDSEGDIYFLEELLVNDSLPFPENESSNFDHHDDPSFSHPPPEPPNVEFFFDFEPNSGELISTVKNNIDELNEDECFDPGGGEIDVFANFEDDDYFPFIFVI